MFAIEFLSFPALYTAVSLMTCDVQVQPLVTVGIVTEKIKYNFDKTSKELSQMKIDTVSPYDKTIVLGLTRGNIETSTSTNISFRTNTQSRQSCLWFDEITISIENKPVIYIAKENVHKKCRYKATMDHEYKHVHVDVQILKKYKSQFRRSALRTANRIGTIGPRHEDELKETQRYMVDEITKDIQKVIAKMDKERRKKQQAVDTKKEYDRIARKCNGMI